MLLYTMSSDLSVNEDLMTFDGDEAALLAKLRRTHDGVAGVESADFGDCWIKLTREPEVDADGLADLDGIKCRVQRPGQHPGGNFYWLTPVESVFVPVFAPASDED